jgi:hypothetical protein
MTNSSMPQLGASPASGSLLKRSLPIMSSGKRIRWRFERPSHEQSELLACTGKLRLHCAHWQSQNICGFADSEVLGSLGVIAGVLTQWAALGLILIGLGAIQKKIFVWRSGFWGEKTYGWHYDLMLVSMNLVDSVLQGWELGALELG